MQVSILNVSGMLQWLAVIVAVICIIWKWDILIFVLNVEYRKAREWNITWSENLTPLNFFFSGLDSEQKAGTSTAITMVQCIHVQLGEKITTKVVKVS